VRGWGGGPPTKKGCFAGKNAAEEQTGAGEDKGAVGFYCLVLMSTAPQKWRRRGGGGAVGFLGGKLGFGGG